MRVILTGATGFVGSELARALLLDPALERLTVIIRPLAGEGAEARFRRLVAHWQKFVRVPDAEALKKVTCVDGDLEGKGEVTLHPFDEGRYDWFFHTAATTDLGVKLDAGRRANVYATQKALRLAARLNGLSRFVHFSTAYVCGKSPGLVREDDEAPSDFHNHYERTKRESEDAVRSSGVPFVILRPSIIVGRSDDGFVARTKVLYSVWRLWLTGLIPRAPLDPKAWVDIVPVDFVVNAALAFAAAKDAGGQAFHLCAGEHRQSPKAIMLAATQAFSVPVPKISPPWVAYALRRWPVRHFIAHALREILDTMYWHLPYLGIRGRAFDMGKSMPVLQAAHINNPSFSQYGSQIFKFCKETAWGKRPRRLADNSVMQGGETQCSA